MTKRSVCLGLVGAALVCGLCFFNDWVLRQNYLVGNNMPASIYGLLILAVVLLNPLLRRFRLTGAELAVILALTLAGASIPGGGLVRTLVPTLVMPHHLVKTHAGWRQEKILDSVPPRMLVDVSSDEDTVVNGYVQGLGKGDEHISVDRVPWRAWLVPLGFWLPMALALWVALIGLSLAIHPQWSRHEHLPFPIAQFTAALLPEPGERTSPLMRNRMFWTTVCVVLAIHMNNFACQWFPDFLIAIPTYFDLRPLAKLLPVLVRGGGAGLLRPHIYLIIIGLAYFIPSDVSLSFGVGPFLWYILLGVFATYGVNLTAPVEGVSYFSLKPQSFALFGANVGVLLAVVYTGRRYYRSVLGQALGSRGGDPVDASALWGMRVFLVACALLVFQLWLIGIELPLVLMYVGFMIMGFVVLSRIIAETGLIYLKCYFWPCATLWAFFGAQAVGPRQLLLMMLVTTVLFIDPREALMPFMTNSLKVLELHKVRLGGPALACVAAIVIGMMVAVPVTLYIKYDMGNSAGESWSTITVPKVAYDNSVAIRRKLAAQGHGAEEETGSFLSRLGAMSATPVCVGSAAAGFVLVLLFTVARLRFTRWPLHPLMFVTWCSTPLRWMGVSYLIGWVVKTAIARYGGSRTYNVLKPLFMGLIAGEVLGALLPSLFGGLYYLITNHQPKMFIVIPG